MGLRLYFVESVAPFLDEILKNLITPHFDFKLQDSFRILCPDAVAAQDLETAALEHPAAGNILIGRSITHLSQFFRDLMEAHPNPRPVAGPAALGKALRLALKQKGTYQTLDFSTQRQYLMEFRRLQHLLAIHRFSEEASLSIPRELLHWNKILREQWGLWTEDQMQTEACDLLKKQKLEILGGLREIFFLGFSQIDGSLISLVESLLLGQPEVMLHLFIPPPNLGIDRKGHLAPLYHRLERTAETVIHYQKLSTPRAEGVSYPTPLHEAHALAEIFRKGPALGFHGHGMSSYYVRELLHDSREPFPSHQVPTPNPSLVPADILQRNLRDKTGDEEIYFKQLQEELLTGFLQTRLDLARLGQKIPQLHLERAYEILLEKGRWESYQEELRPRCEWIQDLNEEFAAVQVTESSPWFPVERLRSYAQPGLKCADHTYLFELNEGVFPKSSSFPLLPALANDPLAEHEAYLKIKSIFHLSKTSACLSFSEQDMDGRIQRPSPLWELFIEAPAAEKIQWPPLSPTGRHPYFVENIKRETHRLNDPLGALDRGDLRSLKLRPLLEQEFQEHPLSATYVDEYAKCPWKFFARRHLKLEEVEEWILEIEPKLKGRLNHALLEKVHKFLTEKFYSRGRIPALAEGDAALEQALSLCLEEWKDHREFQQIPDRLRREEIDRLRHRIRRFLQLELESWKNSDTPLLPDKLEWRFGKAPHPALAYPMKGGIPLPLTGAVDRIDHNPQTGEFLLLDYKTSGADDLARQLREGLSYQLFLYLYAAEQLLFPKGKALGALYGDLKKATKNQGMARREEMKVFGLVNGNSKTFLDAEAFSQLKDRLSVEFEELLQNILTGAYSLSPKECQGERCPYHEICRYDHQPR